jgi:hypothetical protein
VPITVGRAWDRFPPDAAGPRISGAKKVCSNMLKRLKKDGRI